MPPRRCEAQSRRLEPEQPGPARERNLAPTKLTKQSNPGMGLAPQSIGLHLMQLALPSAKLKGWALPLMQPAQAGGSDQEQLKGSALSFGSVGESLVVLWTLVLN